MVLLSLRLLCGYASSPALSQSVATIGAPPLLIASRTHGISLIGRAPRRPIKECTDPPSRRDPTRGRAPDIVRRRHEDFRGRRRCRLTAGIAETRAAARTTTTTPVVAAAAKSPWMTSDWQGPHMPWLVAMGTSQEPFPTPGRATGVPRSESP